jgi:4-amino-4-deoxy-L-arabinose transferase-like glycosyltransferase
VYLLARRIHGVLTARLAAMLAALLPAFTSGVLFAETMSEPLYLFCLACGIYQLYIALADGGVRPHALAGASFALAYLTRPEAMLYFFLAAGALPLYWLVRRQRSLLQAAVRLGALAAGFFVVASPYLIYVREEVGSWTLSTKGRTTYLTTRALVPRDGKVDGAGFLRDTWGLDEKGEVHYFARNFDQRTLSLLLGPYRHRLLPDIRANLGDAWAILGRRSFLGSELLALAAIGLASCLLRKPRSFHPQLFHLLLLTPLAAFLIFFMKERYLYPLLLPCIIWMACGIEAILSLIERAGRLPLLGERWRRRALQACVLMATAMFLARSGYQYFTRRHEAQPDISALTQAIRRHAPEALPVVSAYPHFAFHAGRSWLPLPVATLEEVRRYARQRGGAVIALAGWRMENRPDEQRSLVEAPGDRPGLELIEAQSAAAGLAFALYRITD